MKLASVLGLTVVVILMTLYEWPRMNKNQKKEKMAFVILTTAGWLLAVMLVYFPDMLGPTDLVNMILEPFAKFLKS